ncbi:hypothetical protein HDU97_005230 [Phlyctochytrium planicorne]|nr:hypothetical protein HDU97_005230 [Phlyctochytrium planicorne]
MAIGGINPVPVANFNARQQTARGTTLGFASSPVIPPSSTTNAPVPVRSLPDGMTPKSLEKAIASQDASLSSKKKKKKFSWMKRDSLARRLFIGKVGSRRRQRHDNNNFVDHPLVDPNEPFKPKDVYPIPLPRPKTVFSLVPPALRSKVLAAESSRLAPESLLPKIGEKALTKADRNLRKELRRAGWASADAVASFEVEVVGFLNRLEEVEDVEELAKAFEDAVVVEGASPVKRSNVSVATGSSLGSDDEDEDERRASVGTPVKRLFGPRSVASPCLRDERNQINMRLASSRSSVSSSRSSTSSFSSLSSSNWVNVGRSAGSAVVMPGPNDGMWVLVDATPRSSGAATPVEKVERLSMVISDVSLRLIVHTMCRYYGLLSHSEDDIQGRRITFIYPPSTSLSVVVKPEPQPAEPTPATAETDSTCTETGTETRLDEPVRRFPLPDVSFVDYIFG